MSHHSPNFSSNKPLHLPKQVALSLLEYSESSFTDPHTVVSLAEPAFDPTAFSHIGKIYEGVEPYRMGGHRVFKDPKHPQNCVHHFDPNHREFFVVALEERTLLQALCISTRFFAGNPGSDLVLTLIDDLNNTEHPIPIPHLLPDAEHWLEGIDFHTTRIRLTFKAGGITRIWAFGETSDVQLDKLDWLSKNSQVVFQEDDFFGGPNFALSEQANRSTPHMLGWESSRSAMGLQAVFPIRSGTVQEVVIDTYRHVNNHLRSVWIFAATLPKGVELQKEDCPMWHITSSEGREFCTHDLKAFFAEQEQAGNTLPTYSITVQSNTIWTLQSSFELRRDAMHTRSDLNFQANHICVMLLPHGGLHAIRILGMAD